MLILKNLRKTFFPSRHSPVKALDDISMTIEPGELLVVVGPSGSGKTTLLRVVAGLGNLDGGEVHLDGRSLQGLPAENRDVAMVFQTPALFPHLDVFDNIAFGLKLRKFSKGDIERKVGDVAAKLHIESKLSVRPAELSGGEAQRVALARALVREPKVFLLDEPLSSLDPATRKQLRCELLRLNGELAAPMLYVTHDHREALAMNRRIAVFAKGKLQQIGTPAEIQQRPANSFVADFFNPFD